MIDNVSPQIARRVLDQLNAPVGLLWIEGDRARVDRRQEIGGYAELGGELASGLGARDLTSNPVSAIGGDLRGREGTDGDRTIRSSWKAGVRDVSDWRQTGRAAGGEGSEEWNHNPEPERRSHDAIVAYQGGNL